MLERPVGIWQGLLQIMKHLNTYMCLMMETARISITGERAPPETHYSISKGLLGSVMLKVVLLTAKSVIAPLPGKALPPLGISSSWESMITQISAGYLCPAGRQGCVSALWDWGCPQRASSSLLALGEAVSRGSGKYFPAPLYRKMQICLKHDYMFLERQDWVRWCFRTALAWHPPSRHSAKCVSCHKQV